METWYNNATLRFKMEREDKMTATQTTGYVSYCPEMGEAEPVAQIKADLGHYGKRYFLSTRLELKGRGVKFLNTLKPSDLTAQGQHRVGEHQYKVTLAAFEKICQQYRVSSVSYLD